MSYHITEKEISEAKKIYKDLVKKNNLAKINLEKFWADQEEAIKNPWSKNIPQVPMGIHMELECIQTELEIKVDLYELFHNKELQLNLIKKYNDKAEKIVGKRIMNENIYERVEVPIKGLEEIFEAKNVWHTNSYWLEQSAKNPDELKSLLDRVEKRLENLEEFLFPPNWEKIKEKLKKENKKIPLYRHQRGPVTFATSIYGVENLIFLLYDTPDLAKRFSNLIAEAILKRAQLIDKHGGYTKDNYPHGFSWADDNCALLTPEMYEFFAFPILKKVFDYYAPNPNDWRYQHSDSDMAHLLPVLNKFNLTAVNFGPTLSVKEIRKHMPNTIIQGQLAPFTFSRDEKINIIAEFLRDFNMAKEKRGLIFTTAGSVNDGSKLETLRLIMATIQKYGRYN